MDVPTFADRILGCLLGGAIGDAMGAHFEGMAAGSRRPEPTDLQITDDTQLTLATCEAIIETGQAEPAAIAQQFATWFHDRRLTGLGASTLKALTELEIGGHWALVGHKGEMAAGNGAAMRIAPLAFCLDPAVPSDRRTIRDISRITHHHDEAYTGALAVVVAVRSAWRGEWDGGPGLLPIVHGALPDSLVRDRLVEMSRLDAATPLAEVASRFGASGYVIESVPLALVAAQRVQPGGFVRMLEELISVGGDTDTIASIAGQVVGTLIGRDRLPAPMIARICDIDLVTAIALRFVASMDR